MSGHMHVSSVQLGFLKLQGVRKGRPRVLSGRHNRAGVASPLATAVISSAPARRVLGARLSWAWMEARRCKGSTQPSGLS